MNKLAAALSLSLLLAACDMDDGPSVPETNTPPTVALTATPRIGPAPLDVTLTATATDPDGDTLSYAWSLADLPASPTVSTTFEEVGDFPVTVMVSDGQSSASASVTVSATEGDPTELEPPTEPEPPVNPGPPTNPEPPTNPGPTEPTINVTASPGGPVPWAVRYDVSATGYPVGSTLRVACSTKYVTVDQLDNDSFGCFHDAQGQKVVVTVVSAEGDELDETTLTADVEPGTGVPFGGTWRYTLADGETGTFTLSKVNGTGFGSTDATGDYSLDYLFEDEALFINYYSPAGKSEDFSVEPLANGTQRYVSLGNPDFPDIAVTLEKID